MATLGLSYSPPRTQQQLQDMEQEQQALHLGSGVFSAGASTIEVVITASTELDEESSRIAVSRASACQGGGLSGAPADLNPQDFSFAAPVTPRTCGADSENKGIFRLCTIVMGLQNLSQNYYRCLCLSVSVCLCLYSVIAAVCSDGAHLGRRAEND
jgi:hypothetical protein